MAKQARVEKAPEAKPEDSFVNLMMVAAEFVSSRGGIEAAKEALQDAGRFIDQAGSVSKATRALEVLESLKSKIGT
jgi:triphosphoribosyl-dephospho-CoA synthetase